MSPPKVAEEPATVGRQCDIKTLPLFEILPAGPSASERSLQLREMEIGERESRSTARPVEVAVDSTTEKADVDADAHIPHRERADIDERQLTESGFIEAQDDRRAAPLAYARMHESEGASVGGGSMMMAGESNLQETLKSEKKLHKNVSWRVHGADTTMDEKARMAIHYIGESEELQLRPSTMRAFAEEQRPLRQQFLVKAQQSAAQRRVVPTLKPYQQSLSRRNSVLKKQHTNLVKIANPYNRDQILFTPYPSAAVDNYLVSRSASRRASQSPTPTGSLNEMSSQY